MAEPLTASVESSSLAHPNALAVADEATVEDVLVEDISIDGMCGVY